MRLVLRLLSPVVPLLRWPLRAWVKAYVSPSDTAELALAPDKPVCYVLPSISLSDGLTLEKVCKRHGLPRPHAIGRRLPRAGRAGVVSPTGAPGRLNPTLLRLV